MTLSNRSDQNYDKTYCAIEFATEELTKSMPIELITWDPRLQARLNLESFIDSEIWRYQEGAIGLKETWWSLFC